MIFQKNIPNISQKQLRYGILMCEAKKAIQFAIYDDDDKELIRLIKELMKERKLNSFRQNQLNNKEL